MASTLEAARLTEAHRLAQTRLGVDVVRQIVASWRLLDPTALDATIDRWLSLVVPLVQGHRTDSARLAANYLNVFRTLELGVDAGTFTPILAEAAPAEALATSLVVTGPVQLKAATARLVPLAAATATAQAASAAAAMRHALDGGRHTIEQTVDADTRAAGWARVTGGKPCAFCAMVAARGPIYREDTVRFRSHDRCHCTAEPVYNRGAAWPPRSTALRRVWDDTTRGLPANEARAAFRAAVEAP